MKEITKEMVDGFNEVLKNENSVLYLYKREDGYSVDIKLLPDKYLNMEYQVINPNKNFYKELEDYFLARYEMKITYNNTGSCFWAVI